jgi:hypothetical protein
MTATVINGVNVMCTAAQIRYGNGQLHKTELLACTEY